MNSIPIDCYCQVSNFSESFQCVICKKLHHSKCYGYFLNLQYKTAISVTEILPKNMKCIDCRLKQYEPFLSIKGNLFTPKKYFILNANESYNKRELKADFRSLYSDFQHNQHYEVVIVCSKLKPSAKKAVYENDRLIEKKHQIIPQYEWPSENIFLEWNSYHIKYNKYSYAFVPREQVKQINYLSFTTNDLSNLILFNNKEYQSFITVLFVSRKGTYDVMERVLDHQKSEEITIQQILQEQYKNQIQKTIQYGMEDEQVRLVSPYFSLPLTDPLTFEQIDIPIRGKNCQHIESYDLRKFIENNKDPKENRWKCPRCLITIDIDNIMIDFIQAKILNDMNLIQPQLKHNIQKVFIIDNDLNYLFEHQLKDRNNQVSEIFQQNTQFSLQLNQLKENFPPMIELLDAIFDKNLKELDLDKDGTKTLFDILEISTDTTKLIYQEEQTVVFFSTLFNCQKQCRIYLTPDQDYSKHFSLVYYCEQFYKFTFQGVFADYCCRIECQIKNMINHIMAFVNFYPRQNHFQAIFETSLALSYAIKQNKNFEKYKYKSYGYIVGYLLNLYYEKCQYDNLEGKNLNLKFIHSILSELLFPFPECTESIFNTAEFILKYFNIKNKEGIISIIDTFYLLDVSKLKMNDQLNLSILIYILLVSIKKEKNKNQKNDKSPYYISASNMIIIKQAFEEILDYMSQNGINIKQVLERHHLKFKDFRYAYTILEYSNYYQSPQQAVI